MVDRLVGDVLEALPSGSVLVVTADHGQVEVGNSVELIGPEIMDAVTLISGEGRFRWLHVRPGAAPDVAATALAPHGDVAWVRDEGAVDCRGVARGRAFGGGGGGALRRRRAGAVRPDRLLDPADTGEQRCMAPHGSLTPAEM